MFVRVSGKRHLRSIVTGLLAHFDCIDGDNITLESIQVSDTSRVINNEVHITSLSTIEGLDISIRSSSERFLDEEDPLAIRIRGTIDIEVRVENDIGGWEGVYSWRKGQAAEIWSWKIGRDWQVPRFLICC